MNIITDKIMNKIMNKTMNINKTKLILNRFNRRYLFIVLALALFFTGPIHAATPNNTYGGDVKEILNAVSPSIVKVVTENHKRYYSTGIAIDKNHVIGNMKVLSYRYDRIYVVAVDGKEYPAKLIGKDPQSSIMMLQIDPKVLTPIKWTKKSEVGDWVALVGAFYKKFPAIYNGFISSRSDEEMLLNAPVAPGSSGGAVVDNNGQLVAVVRGRFGFSESPNYTYVGPEAELIVQSSRSGSKELCYALPAEKVMLICADLKKYGKVKRGWLGIDIVPLRDSVAIGQVRKNSPAEKAGICEGDILVKINGITIHTPIDIAQAVRFLKPQQKSKIQWLRNNTNKSAVLVVGEAPDDEVSVDFTFTSNDNGEQLFGAQFPESLPPLENYVFRIIGSRTLGLDVVNINPELAKEFKVKEGTGLLISKVYENSAAEKAGFRVADVLVKVGNKSIASNSDLRAALNTLADQESVAILVYRKGNPVKITITPDKNERLGALFDRFNDQMKNIHLKMDEENQLKAETMEKYRKEQQKIDQINDKPQAKQNELEKYKRQMEIMRKEQDQMRKEMQMLKKMLEKKEKENEKENEKGQTKKPESPK